MKAEHALPRYGVPPPEKGNVESDDMMKHFGIAILACLLPVLTFAQSASAPSNSIHVIWPYNVQGVWAFDDDTKGLEREPFVGTINPMIDALVTNIPDAKVGFRLLFSAGFIPDYDVKLVWTKQEGNGNWYYCEKFKTEGWLCPSLLKYFASAPKEIYIKVGPLPPALIETWKKQKRKGWFDSQHGAGG